MECAARYFAGPKQDITLKLPDMMIDRLKQLKAGDERSSVNQELVYLLGCKMEAIDSAIKRASERQKYREELEKLEAQSALLWKALVAARREKDIDALLPELRGLLAETLAAKAALDDIPIHNEEGVPFRWQIPCGHGGEYAKTNQ